MLLFIQTVSIEIEVTIFKWADLIHTEKILWTNREFEVFPELLRGWIEKFHITKILCITWPGPFTRLRILTLTLNTIKLTYSTIVVRGIGFFEFSKGIGVTSSFVLEANRGEYLVSKDWISTFIKKSDLPAGTYFWFWKDSDFTERGISIEYSYTWEQLEKVFDSISNTAMLSPLYIKEPHITWPK